MDTAAYRNNIEQWVKDLYYLTINYDSMVDAIDKHHRLLITTGSILSYTFNRVDNETLHIIISYLNKPTNCVNYFSCTFALKNPDWPLTKPLTTAAQTLDEMLDQL